MHILLQITGALLLAHTAAAQVASLEDPTCFLPHCFLTPSDRVQSSSAASSTVTSFDASQVVCAMGCAAGRDSWPGCCCCLIAQRNATTTSAASRASPVAIPGATAETVSSNTVASSKSGTAAVAAFGVAGGVVVGMVAWVGL
ncbi:hypothetical protein BC830DRAFT_1095492 [Chytriomyces sp. MP71]|nr:hypothetical protein BC830DRAFT_1095492 [Chytriomyces sp. MP71]